MWQKNINKSLLYLNSYLFTAYAAKKTTIVEIIAVLNATISEFIIILKKSK